MEFTFHIQKEERMSQSSLIANTVPEAWNKIRELVTDPTSEITLTHINGKRVGEPLRPYVKK